MPRPLVLSALLVALAVHAGCGRFPDPAEDVPPAGLRFQPVPGTMAESDESLGLSPSAAVDPFRNP